jgi:hypothetical protein
MWEDRTDLKMKFLIQREAELERLENFQPAHVEK